MDSTRRLLGAAVVLGIGLGGLFDGIVFHQVLQWHHLLSEPAPPTTVPSLQLNTFADGVFHAATWATTLVGVWLLAAAGGGAHIASRGRILTAGLLIGWGAFNVVEGLVDHYLLRIHHVRPGPEEALYDAAFLLWGALFVAVGRWLARTRTRLTRSARRIARRDNRVRHRLWAPTGAW